MTGAPWTIPFEAPVYQLSVVAVDAILPLGLDAVGRITSFPYLISAVAVGMVLLSDLLPGNRFVGLAFATLMFASPQYMFWGRTFLVETCAIFFGVLLLLGTVRYYRRGSVIWLAVLVVVSMLCALSKSTTWPAFAAAAGLFWVGQLAADKWSIRWGRSALLVGAAASTLLITVLWNNYADSLKVQSPFGAQLSSANLSGWNFGNLADRTGTELWFNILPSRILPGAIGDLWPLIVLVAGAAVLFRARDCSSQWRVQFASWCRCRFLQTCTRSITTIRLQTLCF